MKKEIKEKYPEGHFVGKGIAIFMAWGVAIGVALNNIGIGIAIGVAIGVSIGSAWEEKAKKEGKIRPLTDKERKRKKKKAIIALILGFIIAITIATILALRH